MTGDEDDYDFGDGYACTDCDGEGRVMACWDDVCRGSGQCAWEPVRKGCFMLCPSCEGTGDAPC